MNQYMYERPTCEVVEMGPMEAVMAISFADDGTSSGTVEQASRKRDFWETGE